MNDAEVIEVLKETRDMAYNTLNRTDTINKRLITALIVVSMCFAVTMCFERYIDYRCTYTPEVPEVEQTLENSGTKMTQNVK